MGDEDTTRVIRHRQNLGGDETIATTSIQKNDAKPSEDDDHTRIFRPSPSIQKDTVSEFASDALIDDPVVGWLVITNGPGKGSALKLGFGMNPIGRSAEERVSINFGDEEISRTGHAVVTYDPRGNKFYIQHGGGVNLTYLDNSPVLGALELKGREKILIGKTEICFIPFCDQNFSWH